MEKLVRQAAPDVFVSLSSPGLAAARRVRAHGRHGAQRVRRARPAPATSSSMADRLAAVACERRCWSCSPAAGWCRPRSPREIALGTLDSGPTAGLTGVAALAGGQRPPQRGRHRHGRHVLRHRAGRRRAAGRWPDESVIDQYTYRCRTWTSGPPRAAAARSPGVDPQTGALRVGPDSAGVRAGPGLLRPGRHQATVTDADVVLGLLRPGSFLGGRMPLDESAARAAVGRLAGALGLGLEETAAGIVNVNNLQAATADPPADPGTRPRPARLRPVLLRRRGPGARVRLRGRDRRPGGASSRSATARPRCPPTASRPATCPVHGGRDRPAGARSTTRRWPARSTGPSSRARQAMAGRRASRGEPRLEVWALMRYAEQLMHSLEVPGRPGRHRRRRPPAGRLHRRVRAALRRSRGVGVPGGRGLRAAGPGPGPGRVAR